MCWFINHGSLLAFYGNFAQEMSYLVEDPCLKEIPHLVELAHDVVWKYTIHGKVFPQRIW